jgi:hypothetical protein
VYHKGKKKCRSPSHCHHQMSFLTLAGRDNGWLASNGTCVWGMWQLDDEVSWSMVDDRRRPHHSPVSKFSPMADENAKSVRKTTTHDARRTIPLILESS